MRSNLGVLCRELRKIYHHHPENKKEKSSDSVQSESLAPSTPTVERGNAGKLSKTISTMAMLWPVKAIFEKRAATVEVDIFISPALGALFSLFFFSGGQTGGLLQDFPPFRRPCEGGKTTRNACCFLVAKTYACYRSHLGPSGPTNSPKLPRRVLGSPQGKIGVLGAMPRDCPTPGGSGGILLFLCSSLQRAVPSALSRQSPGSSPALRHCPSNPIFSGSAPGNLCINFGEFDLRGSSGWSAGFQLVLLRWA